MSFWVRADVLLLFSVVAALLWADRPNAYLWQGDEPDDTEAAAEALSAAALPLDAALSAAALDDETLRSIIGDARVVAIGEASHGTHEFYQIRADITRRLIEDHGFEAVAIEGDWHAAERVNRYVRGLSDDADPDAALAAFADRFPVWMWRNTVVHEFVGWLHQHNAANPDAQAGFYGLDLYGMMESIDAVVALLETVDPDAAARARDRYDCFTPFGTPETYGYQALAGDDCEVAAAEQLAEIQRARAAYADRMTPEALFSLEQNALVVVDAERYYRESFAGSAIPWNLRDWHMGDTAEVLMSHLQAQGGAGKIVLWAHNSHVGDARATDMAQRGEINLGQLMRETFEEDAVLLGFSTYTGTVTAANNWGEDPHLMQVNPGLVDSYEALFHAVDTPDFLLNLRDEAVAAALRQPRLQRAIGVIYRPQTERYSHYIEADVAEQFDAILHIDETTALEPLDPIPTWDAALSTGSSPRPR